MDHIDRKKIMENEKTDGPLVQADGGRVRNDSRLKQEEGLINRVRQGDEEAFWKWLSLYKNYIYSVLLHRRVDYNDIDDLYLDIGLKLRGSRIFKEEIIIDNKFPYIKRICINAVIDFNKNKFINYEDVSNMIHYELDRDFDLIELAEKVRTGLDRKYPNSPEMIDIFDLRFYENKKIREISEIIKMPLTTVHYRLKLIRLVIEEVLI